MHRTIHGPDKEHLTAAEVARWLGLSVTSFKALVRSGDFPAGVSFGRRSKRWPWMDAVAFAHMRSRMTQPAPRGRP